MTLEKPGIYTVIPCTFDPGVVSRFKISVYANEHIEMVNAPFSYSRLTAQV